MRALALLACLALAGCASMGGALPVAVGLACYSCQALDSAGVCAATGYARDRAAASVAPAVVCPPGYQAYLVNFDAMLRKGEAPRFVCR